MDKKLAKKKTDLMKSILGNTKLAKSFREAMGSPIGSTKREQAKTMFSIMKKLGGVSYDGKGGLGIESTYQNQSTPKPIDYSNMVIFPAAPKLKTQNKQTPSINDGKGGPFTPISTAPSPISYGSLSGSREPYHISKPTGPVPGGAFLKSAWNAIVNPQPLAPRAPSAPLFGGGLTNYQSPLITGAANKLNVPQNVWPTLSGNQPAPVTPTKTPSQSDVDSLMQSISGVREKNQTATTPTTGAPVVIKTDGGTSSGENTTSPPT